MEQIQCPQCGGYKVLSEEYINSATRKSQYIFYYKEKTNNFFLSGGLSFLLAIGILLIAFGIDIYFPNFSVRVFSIQVAKDAKSLIGAILIIIGVVSLFWEFLVFEQLF